MFPLSVRFVMIFIFFCETAPSTSEASGRMLSTELREEEYRQVCKFLSRKNAEIDNRLKENDIREKHGLPQDPTIKLTEAQLARLIELKSSIMLQECQVEFPHISEGGLIAAILAVNAFDDLADNPYMPMYTRPNVSDSLLENAAKLIRDSFDDLIKDVKKSEDFQRCPVSRKKDVGANLLASMIVEKITEDLSVNYEQAMDIHLYLQARSHWTPQDYRLRSPRKTDQDVGAYDYLDDDVDHSIDHSAADINNATAASSSGAATSYESTITDDGEPGFDAHRSSIESLENHPSPLIRSMLRSLSPPILFKEPVDDELEIDRMRHIVNRGSGSDTPLDVNATVSNQTQTEGSSDQKEKEQANTVADDPDPDSDKDGETPDGLFDSFVMVPSANSHDDQQFDKDYSENAMSGELLHDSARTDGDKANQKEKEKENESFSVAVNVQDELPDGSHRVDELSFDDTDDGKVDDSEVRDHDVSVIPTPRVGVINYRDLGMMHLLAPRFHLASHYNRLLEHYAVQPVSESDDNNLVSDHPEVSVDLSRDGALDLRQHLPLGELSAGSDQGASSDSAVDLDLSVPHINGESLFQDDVLQQKNNQYRRVLGLVCGVAIGTLFINGMNSSGS